MNNRSIFTMLIISGAKDDGDGGNIVDHRNRNRNRPSNGRCHNSIRGHHHHYHHYHHHHHKIPRYWIAALLLIVISTTTSCMHSHGEGETILVVVDAFHIIRNTRTKTEIVPCNNNATQCSSLPSQLSLWFQQQQQPHQFALSPSSSSHVIDNRLWTATTTATTKAVVSRQQHRRQRRLRRYEQQSQQVQLLPLLTTIQQDDSCSDDSRSKSDSHSCTNISTTTTAMERISHKQHNDNERKEYRLSKFMSDSLILMYHLSKQLLP